MTDKNMSREKRYNRYKIILSITEMVLGLLFLLLIVTTGFSQSVETWIRTITKNDYLVLLLFTAIIGGLDMIIMLPISWYSGYYLEHKFDLSNQTFGKKPRACWCLFQLLWFYWLFFMPY